MAAKKATEIAGEALEAVKTTTKKATKKAGEKASEVKAVVEEKVAETKAKKVTRKAAKVSVNVEFQGIQHNITDVSKRAEKAYKDGHPDAVIETLDIYCKPEEGVAYYVVNGEGSTDFKVEI